MKIYLLIVLISISSCASYVQSVHNQIDNEQRKRSRPYQGAPNAINNPRTLNSPNTSNQSNLPPGVKRSYSNPGKQRYQASDLVDNQSDGSLWSGKNSESFLFVNNTLKRQGDIVIIEVKKQLKETIQSELKRAFPDPITKKAKAAETPAPEAANTNTQENPEKTYDKISTTVIEQMSQDYLLVRGRKEIMYKKFKRYFEIQAIVSQKDITSRDTVPSLKLLEPRINVLRY